MTVQSPVKKVLKRLRPYRLQLSAAVVCALVSVSLTLLIPVMVGKAIIDKRSTADIGSLCLKYGGGGHRNAGTCQLDNDKADAILPDIIDALNKDCTPLGE